MVRADELIVGSKPSEKEIEKFAILKKETHLAGFLLMKNSTFKQVAML